MLSAKIKTGDLKGINMYEETRHHLDPHGVKLRLLSHLSQLCYLSYKTKELKLKTRAQINEICLFRISRQLGH